MWPPLKFSQKYRKWSIDIMLGITVRTNRYSRLNVGPTCYFVFLLILELNKEISIKLQWSDFWPWLYVQKVCFSFSILFLSNSCVCKKNLFKFFAWSQFALFAFSMSSFNFSKSLDGDRWSVWRGPGRVVARPDWVFLIHRSCQKTRARAKVRNIISFFVCHLTWKDPPVEVFPLVEETCEWLLKNWIHWLRKLI